MIRLLTGQVVAHESEQLILSVAGVGYGLAVPVRLQVAVGETRTLHTHLHVREDNLSLFGFETAAELALFEQLITVPSIGPKLAMAILSIAAPGDIVAAVNGDNAGFFQAIPGLGKKSALKIIVELKGKFGGQASSAVPSGGLMLADALSGLGYEAAEIQLVVARVPAGLSDKEQVAWALRELAAR